MSYNDDEPGGHVLKRRRVLHVFYVDLGWSEGMKLAKGLYDREGIAYEERNLPEDSLNRVLGWTSAEVASFTPMEGIPKLPDLTPPRLGPAVRSFLLDAVNERIEEFEIAETDVVQRIERSTNRKQEPDRLDVERLAEVGKRLASLRAAAKELG
jgi:hypothetical protein